MPRAQRDLADIYFWIGAKSSDTTRAWYFGLKDSIRTLRNAPGRCPVTLENKSLRHLLYGHKPHFYRIIYRMVVKQQLVDVLHIRHGARDAFTLQDFEA
jgi:toxin ParE1/3/4